jgi:hypothetical protein
VTNLGAAQLQSAVVELSLELLDLCLQLRLWRAGRQQARQLELLRLQLINLLLQLPGRGVGSLAGGVQPGKGVAVGVDRRVDPAVQRADDAVVVTRPAPPAGARGSRWASHH